MEKTRFDESIVLRKLLEIFNEKKELSFDENSYSEYFGGININKLEEFLRTLSQKGIIDFFVFADDGFTTSFSITAVNYNSLLMEYVNSANKMNDHPNKRSQKNVVLTVITMLISVLFLILLYSLFFSPYSLIKEILVPIITVLITAIAATISSVLKREQDDIEVSRYSQRLKNTVKPTKFVPENDGELNINVKKFEQNDALNLMLVNMEEIKAYYTLSKTQAKSSFRLAAWMCVLGFVLLVVAVVIPFFSQGKYEVSIITAIGGAIVEVIAGTSLFIYKNSLSQLNHYYESLHDNERFLSNVNLVRKLSFEKQDEMYIEIIRSGINNIKTNTDK